MLACVGIAEGVVHPLYGQKLVRTITSQVLGGGREVLKIYANLEKCV